MFMKNEIDIVEAEYESLVAEYAELKAALMRLRFRRAQVAKQADNLMKALEQEIENKQHG